MAKNTDHLYYFKPLYLQILCSLLVLCAALLLGASETFMVSVFVGASVMCINLAIYTWSLKNLIQKKLIAISVILIVFKWAFLALAIYYVANRLLVMGLLLGLSTIVPAFILWFISGNPFDERDEK